MILDPWKRPYERVRDHLLTDCCGRCDDYAGEGHDYRACDGCPVLLLYAKYEKLRVDASWSDEPRRPREMGCC